MNNNDHVREFLKYYCNLPKEPQYAVLLTGLWGSGKTWFIEDFIANHLNEPERILYLSLFGVQSINDIESKLFCLLHPVLGSKPVRLLSRFVRGALKTTINFDLDGDGKSDGSLSGGIPTDKLLESISIGQSRILVFDDLERCSIPIGDLLGYVNQFIEHGQLKVILIANEGELNKSDGSKNEVYSRIKEKLIGRTFEIVPEVISALEHFANDLPSTKSKEIVTANFDLITQVYNCSTYKNLRLVRHALWDYSRILDSLDSAVQNSEPLLADILALFLSYSFEVQSGKIQPYEIRKLQDSLTSLLPKHKDQHDPNQLFNSIRDKYSGLNLYTSLVAAQVWEVFFSTGSIPNAELNESLLKSKYFLQNNQPNWVKLWHGLNLSDDEFPNVIAQVESEWNSHYYRKIGEVIHVTGLFINYSKQGIYCRTIEQIISSAKEYIDYLFESGDIPITKPNFVVSHFEMRAYAGLGFMSLDEGLFQAFLEYINEKRRNALNSNFPSQAMELLNLIGTDTNHFYRRIVLNNDSENIYYKTPILHLIPPDDFVTALVNATFDDKNTVAFALKERYRFDEFNSDLQVELNWLQQISEKLQIEIANRAGKISSISLNYILNDYVTPSINLLSQNLE